MIDGEGGVCDRMEISNGNMKLLSKMVDWVNGFPELIRAVVIIQGEIARLSALGRVTAEEVQSLGSFLTQVRLLLNDLQRSEEQADTVSTEMCEKYLQVENMIKVLRDDLDDIMMRIVA